MFHYIIQKKSRGMNHREGEVEEERKNNHDCEIVYQQSDFHLLIMNTGMLIQRVLTNRVNLKQGN